MEIQENVRLQQYLSFGTPTIGKKLIICKSARDVSTSLMGNTQPNLILGGGSNMLFVEDYKGCILKNEISGIQTVAESESDITLQFGAGENWHSIVDWCLERNYGGLENLSLIPGTVGAAPIQNIGAYGVELQDVFVSLEAISRKNGKSLTLTAADCAFGYRDSIFKGEAKGEFVICSVQLRLQKKNHRLKTTYGAIQKTLDTWKLSNPSIQDVSKAVIHLRQSKLPDPQKLGNGGSFFKNPIVQNTRFERLKTSYPDIPGYKISDAETKIPAAWLIEKAGWKGHREGAAGVYEKHALVLVNFGLASGNEIWQLACQIQDSIQNTFGILLQAEVNIIKNQP